MPESPTRTIILSLNASRIVKTNTVVYSWWDYSEDGFFPDVYVEQGCAGENPISIFSRLQYANSLRRLEKITKLCKVCL